jgi:two-component system nitrate/nitrite sensor histidine kinase NarX
MSGASASLLYRRISRLRWQAPLLALLLVLLHQIVEHTWLRTLPRWQHFTTQVLFYGLVGPTLAWWALSSLRQSVAETGKAERALQLANRRLSFLIRVNRRLAEASDEEELVEIILALPEEVLPVAGVSLVQLDAREQPRPPLFHGKLSPDAIAVLRSGLVQERVQAQCARCQTHTSDVVAPCALLSAVAPNLPSESVYCFPLTRGDRHYGLLNLYLEERRTLMPKEQGLLTAMAHEISLALESQRLRARELAMLTHLQQTNWWSDLEDDLTGVLAHTVEVLEADGGVFFVDGPQPGARAVETSVGEPLGASIEIVRSLAHSSRETGQALDIQALEQEGSAVRSLLAVPLRTEEEALGTMVLWAARPEAFVRRHLQLASVVAGQAALLVENQRLSLQVEHQAALAERARLAREIHDGLAQTLGYLKLRTTQLMRHYSSGDRSGAMQELEEVERLLSDAYVDAREAIDGLYLTSATTNLAAWVHELAADFEQLSGVPVTVDGPALYLAPAVGAQLQRIVQEALSNIRKHAAATSVQISWRLEEDGMLAFIIHDDGQGFEPAATRLPGAHGLRILQERAALLEADLQLTSNPGKGTRVSVRLPLPGSAWERGADGRTD